MAFFFCFKRKDKFSYEERKLNTKLTLRYKLITIFNDRENFSFHLEKSYFEINKETQRSV